MTSEKKFYVYTLARPDGTVFYVGKGTGYRVDDHERDAKRGEQSHKCHVIRKVWSEGEALQKRRLLSSIQKKKPMFLKCNSSLPLGKTPSPIRAMVAKDEG